MGAGRGWGGRPFPAGVAPAMSMNNVEDLDMLRAEAQEIARALDIINKRVDMLEKPDEQEDQATPKTNIE
jgi:hypothetical protein